LKEAHAQDVSDPGRELGDGRGRNFVDRPIKRLAMPERSHDKLIDKGARAHGGGRFLVLCKQELWKGKSCFGASEYFERFFARGINLLFRHIP